MKKTHNTGRHGSTRFKDWVEGEARFKIHVVTPMGSQIDYYLPHFGSDECRAFSVLASNMLNGGGEIVKAILREERRLRKKDRR